MSLVGNANDNGVDGHSRIGSDSSDSTIAENISSQQHANNTDDKNSTAPAQHSDAESDAASNERRNSAVNALARRYTQQSTTSTTLQNPFNAPPDSQIHPSSEHFNARAWAKAMLHTQLHDPNAPPTRTAGVAFSNLNAHGFGSDTDYQKSVGNVWLEGPGLARKLMGNKGRKINILQNLDGVVEAGEMLVVLGPPGSGCSTFLKTIAGETHGFFIDENSTINYQGMPNPPRPHDLN